MAKRPCKFDSDVKVEENEMKLKTKIPLCLCPLCLENIDIMQEYRGSFYSIYWGQCPECEIEGPRAFSEGKAAFKWNVSVWKQRDYQRR